MSAWSIEVKAIADDMWQLVEKHRLAHLFTQAELTQLLAASEGDPIAVAKLQDLRMKMQRVVEARRAPS